VECNSYIALVTINEIQISYFLALSSDYERKPNDRKSLHTAETVPRVTFSLQGLQQPLNVPLGNVHSFHHSDEPLGKLVLVDCSRFCNGGSSLCFKLLPGLGAIVVNGIAYLDIFGQTSSGGLSVSVVGHCGVIGSFGNQLLFFALEEGLFVFSIF
jgi:hypothetical protein